MAKKKAGGPNMSEEIRTILTAKPTASNKEIFETLTKKFGKGKFNEASCGVAASGQRKRLGIGKSKKAVRKKKPGRPAGTSRGPGRPRKTAKASTGDVNFDALRAAKALLTAVDGDDSAAIAAIRQLHSLQIG